MARDNFLHTFAAGRTGRILKNRCKWLLTPIVAGIVLHGFRLQGHEPRSGRARVSSQAYAVDERSNCSQLADAVTRCRRFSPGTGLRREVGLLWALGASPG